MISRQPIFYQLDGRFSRFHLDNGFGHLPIIIYVVRLYDAIARNTA